MNAHDGAGFARLLVGDPQEASRHFTQALELYPDHARSLVGLGASLAAAGTKKEAAVVFSRAQSAIEALRRGGRGTEATIANAFLHAAQKRKKEALQCLAPLVEGGEMPYTGWTLPIEPLLQPLHDDLEFRQLLTALASRAR